ncbi:hypothetical protein COBT_000268 [Conglomerata obtusa]
MYRSRFSEQLDNLRHEYELVIQENISLKSHIKDLEDKLTFQLSEIKQTKTYIKDLNQYITSLRRVPIDFKPEPGREKLKRIKLGSDWCIEGDELFDIKLLKQVNFYHSVSHLELSLDGLYAGLIIARNVYLYDFENEHLYLVNNANETIDLIQVAALKKPVGNDESIFKICFSSDSNFIYTTNQDKIIKKWNLNEKKLTKKINVKDEVMLMTCNCDSLFALCKDSNIRIYDEDKVKEIPFNIKNNPTCLRISNNFCFIMMVDKKMIVLNTTNDEIRVINLPRVVHRFDIRNNYMVGCGPDEFSYHYKLNLEFMEVETELPIKGKGRILYNKFIEDKIVVCAGADSKVRVIDLENDKIEILNGYFEHIAAINLSKGFFCTISAHGRLRIWTYEKNTL